MKTMKLIPLLTVGLLTIMLSSCGPSYVGVRTAPAYGGYYGPRPYYNYNYGYRPYYGYRRPPVIVQRNTYVVPRGRGYYNNRSYSPNARSGRYDNGGYRSNGNGRTRGPR